MVVLYLFARLLLGGFHLLLRWRVRRLEKRYVRFAADADALLAGAAKRGGTNRHDPFVNAKLQYDLALLAKKRDRVEDRYLSWQKFSERFGSLRGRVAGYRGRLLPYLFGLVDVTAVVLVLGRLGGGVEDVRALIGM
jgi:hypothetical protein